jgi:hypothetical protein
MDVMDVWGPLLGDELGDHQSPSSLAEELHLRTMSSTLRNVYDAVEVCSLAFIFKSAGSLPVSL